MNERPADQKQDMFDRIMTRKIMKPLYPFYTKFKEQLLYLFFGGLTTILSIVLFWAFTEPMGMNALAANVIVWIICVSFAYATNRTWVFADKAYGRAAVTLECISFFAGRFGTLVLEELVLWIGIALLSINAMAVKVFAQILVIVGNYLISKCFVFTANAEGKK